MEIKPGKLKGTFEIILDPHTDKRGFFMRTFDDKLFEKAGINNKWVQENHSRSEKKGIIRGLHFQLSPFAETKMIRCIRGKIWDVFVDLRKGSNTFGKWDAIELSEENKKMVLIPRGFAHGFCTLTNISEILYKHDNYYNPDYESGIIWNDKGINIKWPVTNPVLSRRDNSFGTFKNFVANYKAIKA